MNVCALLHHPVEGLGCVEDYLLTRGHQPHYVRLYNAHALPRVEDFDWLIAMGGPMSVHDTKRFPWLKEEKKLISSAIAADRRLLGICLGAQLVAEALGAEVKPNDHREIGWHPIRPAAGAAESAWGDHFREPLEMFHWHGERFSIPQGAVHLASSDACENQAFAKGARVVGLQFHAEVGPHNVYEFAQAHRDDLDGSKFVQSEMEFLGDPERFTKANQWLCRLLDQMAKME